MTSWFEILGALWTLLLWTALCSAVATSGQWVVGSGSLIVFGIFTFGLLRNLLVR